MNIKDKHNHQQLKLIVSADQMVKVDLITDMESGESRLRISKEYSQDFPTKDIDKVKKLADSLMSGNGRTHLSVELLDDIEHNRQPVHEEMAGISVLDSTEFEALLDAYHEACNTPSDDATLMGIALDDIKQFIKDKVC